MTRFALNLMVLAMVSVGPATAEAQLRYRSRPIYCPPGQPFRPQYCPPASEPSHIAPPSQSTPPSQADPTVPPAADRSQTDRQDDDNARSNDNAANNNNNNNAGTDNANNNPPQQPTQPEVNANPLNIPNAAQNQNLAAGTSSGAASVAPNMIGDFFGSTTQFTVTVPGLARTVSNPDLLYGAAFGTTEEGFVRLRAFDPSDRSTMPEEFVFESLQSRVGINTATFDTGPDVDPNGMDPSVRRAFGDTPIVDRFSIRPRGDSEFKPSEMKIVRDVGGQAVLLRAETRMVDDTDITDVEDNAQAQASARRILTTRQPNDFTTPRPGQTLNPDDPMDPDFDVFLIDLDQIEIPLLQIQVPVGALAGQLKLAENSSPMPRDRVIFNYSFFDNVALRDGGVQVNRYTPGFEKTFFDGNMSIEMRAPFATTMDSDIKLRSFDNGMGGSEIRAGNTSAVEFGNAQITLKALLYNNNKFALSTGLGISLPTADDTTVRLPNEVEVLKFSNNATHFLPFIGAVYAPTNRLFMQAIFQLDIASHGNPVNANLNPNDTVFRDFFPGGTSNFPDGTRNIRNDIVDVRLFGPAGLQQIGTLTTPTFLYTDLSMGYWIYDNPCYCAKVSRVALMGELHINQQLEDFDSVTAEIPNADGAAVTIQAPDPRLKFVTAILGANIELKRNTTVSLGYALPISEDQVFDGELRLNFNHYFGCRNRGNTPVGRAAPFN